MLNPGIEEKRNGLGKITRRKFLGYLIASLAVACSGKIEKKEEIQEESFSKQKQETSPQLTSVELGKDYVVRGLTLENSGFAEKFFNFVRKVDGLYWKYLGLDKDSFQIHRFYLKNDQISENKSYFVFVTDRYIYVKANFYEILKKLLKEKEVENGGVAQFWEEFKQARLEAYGTHQPTRINLEQYLNAIETILNVVRNSFKNLNQEDKDYQIKNLCYEFIKSIESKMLVSLAIREILPPPNFKGYSSEDLIIFNIIFFEILLYSAGTQFIEHIPALHDRTFSFGPFQITNIIEESVKNGYLNFIDDESFKENFANLWNIRREEVNIPFNITGLEGSWHYVWFVLNVINNIYGILLANKENDKFLNFFEEIIIKNQWLVLAISAFIHHQPVLAVNFINFLFNQYQQKQRKLDLNNIDQVKKEINNFLSEQNPSLENYIIPILDYFENL